MGSNGKLNVPDEPIIPFIEGDGIGPDVWRASRKVLDAAVAQCRAAHGKQTHAQQGGRARPRFAQKTVQRP